MHQISKRWGKNIALPKCLCRETLGSRSLGEGALLQAREVAEMRLDRAWEAPSEVLGEKECSGQAQEARLQTGRGLAQRRDSETGWWGDWAMLFNFIIIIIIIITVSNSTTTMWLKNQVFFLRRCSLRGLHLAPTPRLPVQWGYVKTCGGRMARLGTITQSHINMKTKIQDLKHKRTCRKCSLKPVTQYSVRFPHRPIHSSRHLLFCQCPSHSAEPQ